MSQFQENLWVDGRRDTQTLFYRAITAETRSTTTSLQQLTAVNTPNLVLKTMKHHSRKYYNLKTKIRQKRKLIQKRKL